MNFEDPENYLEWEKKMDRLFDFKNLDDKKKCKYAIRNLGKEASIWWEGVKAQRVRAGKTKISSWESLKRKLKKKYVPTHRLSIDCKMVDFEQGKSVVGECVEKFENQFIVADSCSEIVLEEEPLYDTYPVYDDYPDLDEEVVSDEECVIGDGSSCSEIISETEQGCDEYLVCDEESLPARHVFDEMPKQDSISRAAMINYPHGKPSNFSLHYDVIRVVMISQDTENLDDCLVHHVKLKPEEAQGSRLFGLVSISKIIGRMYYLPMLEVKLAIDSLRWDSGETRAKQTSGKPPTMNLIRPHILRFYSLLDCCFYTLQKMENVLCKTESEFNRGFVGPLFGVTYSKHMIQVNDQIIFSVIRNGKIKAWLYVSFGSRVYYRAVYRIYLDVHKRSLSIGVVDDMSRPLEELKEEIIFSYMRTESSSPCAPFVSVRNGIPSSSGARVLGEEHEDVHGSVIGVGTIVGITTGYAFLLIIVLRLDLYDVANHRGTTRVQVEVVFAELYNAISQTTNTLNFFAGLCNSVGVGGYLNGGSYGFLLNNSGSAVVYVADVRFIGDELFWAIDSGGVYNNDEREPLAKCFKAIPEHGRVVIITLEVSVAEMVTNILEAILYCLNIIGNIITRWVVPNVFKFGVVDPIVEMVVDTEWHIWHARTEEMQFQIVAVSFRVRIRGVHSSVMVLLIVTVMDSNVDGARQNLFGLLARGAVLDDFKDDLSHLGWKLLSRKIDTVFRDLNLLLHHHTKVDFIERFSETLLVFGLLDTVRVGHNPGWRNNVSITFSFDFLGIINNQFKVQPSADCFIHGLIVLFFNGFHTLMSARDDYTRVFNVLVDYFINDEGMVDSVSADTIITEYNIEDFQLLNEIRNQVGVLDTVEGKYWRIVSTPTEEIQIRRVITTNETCITAYTIAGAEVMKDTHNDLCKMIAKTWKHDVMGVIAAVIFSPLMNSEHFDMEYLGRIYFGGLIWNEIVFWDVGAFLTVAKYQGDFKERILHVLKEVAISNGRSVLFNDEFVADVMILLMGARAVLSYMDTMFGDRAAQEVIKACSGMFHPIFQLLYFVSIESFLEKSRTKNQTNLLEVPKTVSYASRVLRYFTASPTKAAASSITTIPAVFGIEDVGISELRTIPFKGGGDDTSVDTGSNEELILIIGNECCADFKARGVCLLTMEEG